MCVALCGVLGELELEAMLRALATCCSMQTCSMLLLGLEDNEVVKLQSFEAINTAADMVWGHHRICQGRLLKNEKASHVLWPY